MATIRKVAAATRPIVSVLRAGLRAPLRAASRESGKPPAETSAPVAPALSRCQSQARQADRTINPAPKKAPACASPERPSAAAPNTTANGREIQTIQRLQVAGRSRSETPE